MKVLVCGSREFKDYDYLKRTLDGHDITEIIHGDARGADTLADQYAERHGTPCRRFPADWNTYGRRAGHVRNTKMLDEGKPELVIAFWDGKSRGTQNMINQAEMRDFPVIIVDTI